MSDMTIPERADELDNALYGAMPADERLRLICQALLAEHKRGLTSGRVTQEHKLFDRLAAIEKEAEGGE
jgi:hypothetical protein